MKPAPAITYTPIKNIARSDRKGLPAAAPRAKYPVNHRSSTGQLYALRLKEVSIPSLRACGSSASPSATCHAIIPISHLSNRSADPSCRSAAFSFKSSRSHRLSNARHGEKKQAEAGRVAATECGPWRKPWKARGAGPALRPCGSSSGAASCRTANKIIGISHRRAAKTTARWKSRKAGERALRYIFLCFSPAGSHGRKEQNKKQAPAGATEIIHHRKQLCRPLTAGQRRPQATIAHIFVGAVRELPLRHPRKFLSPRCGDFISPPLFGSRRRMPFRRYLWS
jgi:hypothetical protein